MLVKMECFLKHKGIGSKKKHWNLMTHLTSNPHITSLNLDKNSKNDQLLKNSLTCLYALASSSNHYMVPFGSRIQQGIY